MTQTKSWRCEHGDFELIASASNDAILDGRYLPLIPLTREEVQLIVVALETYKYQVGEAILTSAHGDRISISRLPKGTVLRADRSSRLLSFMK